MKSLNSANLAKSAQATHTAKSASVLGLLSLVALATGLTGCELNPKLKSSKSSPLSFSLTATDSSAIQALAGMYARQYNGNACVTQSTGRASSWSLLIYASSAYRLIENRFSGSTCTGTAEQVEQSTGNVTLSNSGTLQLVTGAGVAASLTVNNAQSSLDGQGQNSAERYVRIIFPTL
jgi:hypothetical protein